MDYTYEVTKDGKTLFRGSETDCWIFIHKRQGCSVDWATKHEGYKIERVEPIGQNE